MKIKQADTMERRTVTFDGLRIEARAEGESGPGRLVGHAAVFDSLSLDLGGFKERILPGAFAASIAEDDIRALFNHDPNHVLGRNVAGTLTLAEDKTGLQMSVDLPDTQTARDLAVSIERGDVTQQSFGFQTISDEWSMEDGEEVRTLKAVKLFDVSPVTFAAYPQTDVAKRSLDAFKARIAEERKPRGPNMKMLRHRVRLAELT